MMQIMTMKKTDSRNVFSRCCLKLRVFFLRLYIKLFHALERLSTYQAFFSSVTLKITLLLGTTKCTLNR